MYGSTVIQRFTLTLGVRKLVFWFCAAYIFKPPRKAPTLLKRTTDAEEKAERFVNMFPIVAFSAEGEALAALYQSASNVIARCISKSI